MTNRATRINPLVLVKTIYRMKRLILCADNRSPYEGAKGYWTYMIHLTEEYAKTHNIDFKFMMLTELIGGRSHQWARIPLLLSYVDNYDEIMWLDSDISIINRNIDAFQYIKTAPESSTQAKRDKTVQSILYSLTNNNYDFLRGFSGIFVIDCKDKEKAKLLLEDWWNDISDNKYKQAYPWTQSVWNDWSKGDKQSFIRVADISTIPEKDSNQIFVHILSDYGKLRDSIGCMYYNRLRNNPQLKHVGIYINDTDIYTNLNYQYYIYLRLAIESTGRTVQFISDTNLNYVNKDIKLYYLPLSEINLKEFSHIVFTSEFVNSYLYKYTKRLTVKTVYLIPDSLQTKYNERMIYTNCTNNQIPIPANLDTLVDEVWVRDTHDDTKLFLKTTFHNKLAIHSLPMLFDPIFKNKRIKSMSYASVKMNIIIMDRNEDFMTLAWKSLIIANGIYMKNKDRISNVYLFNKPNNKEGMSEHMMRSLDIVKDNKLKLFVKTYVSDIINFAVNNETDTTKHLFISSSFGSFDTQYLHVLYAGFPFLHSYECLKDNSIGYFYNTIDNAIDWFRCEFYKIEHISYVKFIDKYLETLLPHNNSHQIDILLQNKSEEHQEYKYVNKRIEHVNEEAIQYIRNETINNRIGIFIKRQNIYGNGVGQNCIFLRDSFIALGYKVDFLDIAYDDKNKIIIEDIVYTDVNSVNFSDYILIIYGSIIPSPAVLKKISETNVKTTTFYCMNTIDGGHNELFLYDNRKELFNNCITYDISNEIWCTDNHFSNVKTYLETLNNRKVTVKEIPITWMPRFLKHENKLNKYVQGNGKKLNIIIMEPNFSYCKNASSLLYYCEMLNYKFPDIIDTVRIFNVVGRHETIVKIYQSSNLYKSNKLKLYSRVEINVLVSFLSHPPNVNNNPVVFLSHNINIPVNYAYFDILYSGFPFVHNSTVLRDNNVGFYYKSGDESVDILSNILEISAIDQSDDIRRFIEKYNPHNTRVLNEIYKLLTSSKSVVNPPRLKISETKQSTSNITLVYICGNDDRKEFQMKQVQELGLPFNIHYFRAFTPAISKDYIKDYDATYPESPQEICCTRSHIGAIQWYIENSNTDYVLICEDDVSFLKTDFADRLNTIIETWKHYTDIDFISIGYLPHANKRSHMAKYQDRNLYWSCHDPIQNIWGLQAYLIKRKSAQAMVELLYKSNTTELRTTINEYIKRPGVINHGRLNRLQSDSLIPMFFKQGFVYPMMAIEMPFPTLIHTTGERHKMWVDLVSCNYVDPNQYYMTNEITLCPKKKLSVLVLRIFNHSERYDAMRGIHRKYGDDSIYVIHNPELATEYRYTKEEQLLEIKGEETFIPGILVKTIKAIEICLKLFDFDILVRSNVSTIINRELFQSYMDKVKNIDNFYGGHQETLYKITEETGSGDSSILGLKFPHGTGITLSRNLCVQLCTEKDKLNYNIIDDVSIGNFFKDRTINELKLLIPKHKISDIP